MGIPITPRLLDAPTERTPNENTFPEYITSIKGGSDSAPNTELSLDDDFYELMGPFLARHGEGDGANGRTYTASHLIAAARDARSNPHSSASGLIARQFLCYLHTVCEDDLRRWALKDRERPLNGKELWEYICCALRPKLNMCVTMQTDGRGDYVQDGGHSIPATFKTFQWFDQDYVFVTLQTGEGERRRFHTLAFPYRELLDLEAVGIHLDSDPLMN